MESPDIKGSEIRDESSILNNNNNNNIIGKGRNGDAFPDIP
jgi:hypothetical protein